MRTWSKSQLTSLGDAFSLHFSAGPARPDAPEVEIGMVVVGSDLFVRALRGRASRWYRAGVQYRRGRIRVAGVTTEVAIAAAGEVQADLIDAAYRQKYDTLASLAVGSASREATLQISPW
ncbi:DUF2255 family protein [Actinoplanes sp. TBRC 11911]|uniref:DUF2255 family protein n=1 Tax=Actinoplanes sp. TBRC 11911 TaxID=2729386 RepID=UPI00145EF70D|nr:DUF2255 family protein [Actinoplanes sp. TBRC 11911]NMO56842.1 DUF2255 family protein [Actinoplanes sp. TBRC 11911]